MFRTVFLFLFALALALIILPGGVMAEDMGNKAKRLELATEMNKIRPARAQVDEAVKAVSAGLPPMDKERLFKLVNRAFDYAALEKLSIETMAELFSEVELEKMVAYFGSPEARAISAKLPQYQEKLQPAIIKMLDAALMVEKTGGPADKVAPAEDAPAKDSPAKESKPE